MKKKIAILGISGMLLLSGVASAAPLFKDLKEGHWAESSVKWGVEKEIVNGYKDGTFKPNAFVTEAEFIKMLVQTYDVEVKKGSAWYDGYYDIATANGWVSDGITWATSNYRNADISRGDVARLLASAEGKIFMMHDDAIQYLFDAGMSEGKTSKTIEGYKAKDKLTRAEAIKFVKTFVDKRTTDKLVKAKVVETVTPIMTPDEKSLASLEKQLNIFGISEVTKSVSEGSNLSISGNFKDGGTFSISLNSLSYKGDQYLMASVVMSEKGFNKKAMEEVVSLISNSKVSLKEKQPIKGSDAMTSTSGLEYNFIDNGSGSIICNINYKY